jgi:hypothetical protein
LFRIGYIRTEKRINSSNSCFFSSAFVLLCTLAANWFDSYQKYNSLNNDLFYYNQYRNMRTNESKSDGHATQQLLYSRFAKKFSNQAIVSKSRSLVGSSIISKSCFQIRLAPKGHELYFPQIPPSM